MVWQQEISPLLSQAIEPKLSLRLIEKSTRPNPAESGPPGNAACTKVFPIFERMALGFREFFKAAIDRGELVEVLVKLLGPKPTVKAYFLREYRLMTSLRIGHFGLDADLSCAVI